MLSTFLSIQCSPGTNKPGDKLESAPRHNTERPHLNYWTIISSQVISVSPNKIYWVILISLHFTVLPLAIMASSIPFLTTDTGSKITHFIHKTWTLHNSHSKVKGAGFKEVSLKTGQTVDPDTVGHCGRLNVHCVQKQCGIFWCHKELCNFKVVLVQGSVGSGQGEDRCRTRKRLCHSTESSQAAGTMLSRRKGDSQEFISSPFLSIPWCIHNMLDEKPGVTAACSCFRCPSFHYPDEAVIASSDLRVW